MHQMNFLSANMLLLQLYFQQ